ncbi:MAG: YkgJ family cysteine cluster protein [Methanospirillaceae archaeon]|nr:YkgJ family cysteine cluster protein [Methanospirillaceae archaeon]
MGFECRQCGICCLSLGPYLTVISDSHDGTYQLYHEVTGETDLVRIDPDKLHLLSDTTLQEEEPEACTFLRRDPASGRVRCIVHATRPLLCQQYACYEILITYPDREWAGRVKGGRALLTADPGLRNLWDEMIQPLAISNDTKWRDTVRTILSARGYQVIW